MDNSSYFVNSTVPANLSNMHLHNNLTNNEDQCIVWAQWLLLFHHRVEYASILIAFSAIIIALNLTLIISFIATKQVTKNTANIFIFVLSLSNMITGTVSLPLNASIFLELKGSGVCLKLAAVYLSNSFEHFSVVLTVLVAIDRYIHMNPRIESRPSRAQVLLQKPNVYYQILFVFITCTLLLAFKAFYPDGKVAGNISILSLTLLSAHIIIIAFLYTRGYLRIRKFTYSNPIYNNQSVRSTRVTPDYIRRLYKTVLALILLAMFQYVPYCLICILAGLLTAINRFSINSTYAYFIEVSALLMFAGYFTNCLAVLHWNKQAKHWILKKLRIMSP